MASGTISLVSNSSKLAGRISWSSTPNFAENKSSVTVKLQVKRTDSYTTTGTWNYMYMLERSDGTDIYSKTWDEYKGSVTSSWKTVKTLSFTVSHSSSGQRTLKIYTVIYGPDGTSLEGAYVTENSSGTGVSFTLDKIEREAKITSAPNFDDTQNPTISYSNKAGTAVSSLQACIASSDGTTIYVPYRDISKTGTSYTFNLTDAERTTLRSAFTTANSGTVKFYVQTVIGSNTYRNSVAKTFTIANPSPTLNPTVVDTDATALTLTGDNSKFIKYYSNAQITFNAAAVKNATLKSKKVTCGAKSRTADGLIGDVESATFVFTATDSRGNTTTKTITKTLINYVKLTCNMKVAAPSTEGETTITINGNCFSGSFGAKNNTLTVYYRRKDGSGDYGDWTAVTATISGTTYSAQIPITGLDYQTYYTFQARAQDLLATVDTSEKRVKTTPVFDWGENDFNFNVPVKLNNVHTLRYSEAANTVLASEGNQGIFLRPNGSFNAENEAILYKDGKLVVAGFNLTGAARAMTTSYALETTATAATNYTVNSVGNAILLGNNLRCSFNVTRSSAVSGNITNEKVLTLKIKHSGKIKGIYSDLITTGADGAVSTFYVSNSANDGTYVTFDIVLSATAASNTYFSTYFTLPCLLNLDNF